ncbi:MAG: four helix bundle protein [Verrucomicrobia bacterium]|nr:four helix bundle protein [Verrucomicrobiota bacterium]
MTDLEKLLPPSGGYRKLKSFQMSRLVYDITVRFCDLYVPLSSRTHDQMVQAARAGLQNTAQPSAASGPANKFQMKFTGGAWASLGELELDFEDYLRHWGLPMWEPEHEILRRFKATRCSSLEAFRRWIAMELKRPEALSVGPCPSVQVRAVPCPPAVRNLSTRPDAYAANGALSLLNLARYWIKKQLGAQGEAFLEEGGFTERLYKLRKQGRRRQWT